MKDKEFGESLKGFMENNGNADGFFENFDETVPTPDEVIARGEGRATYMTSPAPTPSFTRDELKRRNRKTWAKRLAPIVSVAACAAIVFGVVIPRAGSGAADFPFAAAEFSNYENVVASEDYDNLFRKIKAVSSDDRYSDSILGPLSLDGDVLYESALPDNVGVGKSEASSPVKSDTSADSALAENAPQADAEFSDTNIQTEGVMEADVVKTDGDLIFAINSENLAILKASDGQPEVISKIDQQVGDGQYYFEMFILENRLVCIRQGYNANDLRANGEADKEALDKLPKRTEGCIAYPTEGFRTDTSVDVFDITEPKNPVKINSLSQSGDYITSRMIGDKLYLITSYSEIYSGDIRALEPETFVPLYAAGEKQYVSEAADIAFAPDTDEAAYTVISGIDATAADFVSRKSVMGYTGQVYSSAANIFLTADKYKEDKRKEGKYTYYTSGDRTEITKVSISDGEVTTGAAATVPGSILNQFSMDEWGGVLRVVTTEDIYGWVEYNSAKDAAKDGVPMAQEQSYRSNALYTLDENMELLGKVDKLAKDEQIYSCRFMEDICYFVTFLNTDPLFSVDVSDPSDPKVLGALKIPGFSEYLHPYDDGLLFGLGKDADERTGDVGALKLSMFDNSDPANVKEKHTLVLDGEYYSPAEYNHKAILVDKRKNLVAFPAEDSYLIYSYSDERGFEKLAEIQLKSEDVSGYHGYYDTKELRGLFIGDIFYVISPNTVQTYDMNDGFARLGSARIGKDAHSVTETSYWDWEMGNGGAVIQPFAIE
ncbi:MAG: beta-propeller domain-containing protein [Clostridiales Family XIII bacterium]|jgi:uncharacterized secreted protein with C-terminal beta-propeller domain|nr:beta-propeller domain-containing protein [Clostridiales Family XIII bacterium]